VLWADAAHETPSSTGRLLGVASATGAAWSDWRHRRRIRPVFRAEAALVVLLAASWLLPARHVGTPPTTSPFGS
jgi:hypothetical protein